jgi:hypothetical protein
VGDAGRPWPKRGGIDVQCEHNFGRGKRAADAWALATVLGLITVNRVKNRSNEIELKFQTCSNFF